MSIKESMSKLKQAQAQMQENYAKEINGKSIFNASISEDCWLLVWVIVETTSTKLIFLLLSGLKNQIENKEKEILLLRGNCELSDKLSK